LHDKTLHPRSAEGSAAASVSDAPAADKKVFIKTFGCQMNVYDSERMSEALRLDGYGETSTIEDADLVILNTCHIREKAAEKVYSDLGRIRQLKESRRADGKDTVVTVAGCVAQAEGTEIVRRAPSVDLVVGPQSYHRLPALIAKLGQGASNLVETEFPEQDKFGDLPARTVPPRQPSGATSVTAFLTVQEGCDKFCSFCVVPYTRGVEYSRPVADLETELQSLVARGVKEVTLLGQNVNAYHGVGANGAACSLADLLWRLSRIEGVERLRYMTSHPNDMDDDLIALHGQEPKLMPYLHLPFQAGSDRILAAMNRKHTRATYRDVIARVRAACPGIALSTDIIVGFPGETDDDFEQTLRAVEDIGFAQSYSFKYSPRPGTPASTLDEQVPERVKTERLARLQQLLKAQQNQFNAQCVGRTMPVLLERRGRRQGHLAGRSPYLQLVHVEAGADMLGTLQPVTITDSSSNSLTGRVDLE
jgi:tRNA-2-methylthio-N6-dimethylallyladenosine synthase